MSSYLEVIFGPMKSGKTERLITLANQIAGDCGVNKVVIVRNNIDSRDKLTRCSWLSIGDYKIIRASSISDVYDELMKYDYIFIDEGQFFEDLRPKVQELLDNNKQVYVSGLIGTSENTPFNRMLDIMYFADKVTQLKAVCDDCGGLAIYSYYNGNDKKAGEIKIGDSEYLSLCRNCYNKRMFGGK